MPKHFPKRRSWSARQDRRRSNAGNRNNENNSGESSQSASADIPDENSQGEDDLELPGFYYNKVTKKYFRLLPGHNNYNPLTKDTLKQKELDKKRQNVLQGKKTEGKKLRKSNFGHTLPIPMFQHQIQIGSYSPHLTARSIREKLVNEMHYISRLQIRQGGPIRNSHMLVDTENNGICLGLVTTKSRLLYFTKLVPDEEHPMKLSLSTLRGVRWVEGAKEVTSICWAPSDGNNTGVLHSSLMDGARSSVSLWSYPRITGPTFRYIMDGTTAWTCAWSDNHIAVGASGEALLIDVATSNKVKINTYKSDVFAQTFAVQSPLLFNGTRKGNLLGCDLRQPYGKAVNLMHKSSVCCIKMLKDENYVVASDMASKILLWDLRAMKPVVEYLGHTNSHMQIPFHIDSTESIIYSGGMDTLVRFWRLQDGLLLHTTASPLEGVQPGPPLVHYSEQWTKRKIPGLLMAHEQELFWFNWPMC